MTPETDPVYQITDYTCTSCGRTFSLGIWTPPEPPDPEPLLTCPRCKQTAVRTDTTEKHIIEEYFRLRKAVNIILDTRTREHHLRNDRP